MSIMSEAQDRTVFLLTHTGRPAAIRSAERVVQALLRCGIGVRLLADEAVELPLPEEVELVTESGPEAVEGCELIVVLGGDGTLLRGAEFSRASGVPLLGVNLGRVGFLAEAERDDLDKVVDRVVTRDYEVEERMTLDVLVRNDGQVVHTDWALNEASVEKVARERMLEVVTEVDDIFKIFEKTKGHRAFKIMFRLHKLWLRFLLNNFVSLLKWGCNVIILLISPICKLLCGGRSVACSELFLCL